jgi:hypothetical protein
MVKPLPLPSPPPGYVPMPQTIVGQRLANFLDLDPHEQQDVLRSAHHYFSHAGSVPICLRDLFERADTFNIVQLQTEWERITGSHKTLPSPRKEEAFQPQFPIPLPHQGLPIEQTSSLIESLREKLDQILDLLMAPKKLPKDPSSPEVRRDTLKVQSQQDPLTSSREFVNRMIEERSRKTAISASFWAMASSNTQIIRNLDHLMRDEFFENLDPKMRDSLQTFVYQFYSIIFETQVLSCMNPRVLPSSSITAFPRSGVFAKKAMRGIHPLWRDHFSLKTIRALHLLGTNLDQMAVILRDEESHGEFLASALMHYSAYAMMFDHRDILEILHDPSQRDLRDDLSQDLSLARDVVGFIAREQRVNTGSLLTRGFFKNLSERWKLSLPDLVAKVNQFSQSGMG